MKSKIILVLCILSVSLFSFITLEQDTKTAIATYDGYEYEMYSFAIPAKDDSEADTIIAFSEIPEAILKEFDLTSNALEGQDFEITYEVIVDADSNDDIEDDEVTDEAPESTYVLKSLKKIKKK